VRELLAEALDDKAGVMAALPVTKAELAPIHTGPDVTIVKVVWGPSMSFPPHDHLTWACNGVYGGAETNTLYRFEGDALVASDGFELRDGDIGILDADAVHSVTNPHARQLSAAIHVYGGDFLNLPRSNWLGDPPTKTPADVEQTKAMFEAANRRL
jgi:predicted metal-dependent enzyme (double-stranded beta helix superfamily)